MSTFAVKVHIRSYRRNSNHTVVVYHLHGKTGSSTVCANGKQKRLMLLKFRPDWPLKKTKYQNRLKGLGHAILGNFRTDQMVIELTKI